MNLDDVLVVEYLVWAQQSVPSQDLQKSNDILSHKGNVPRQLDCSWAHANSHPLPWLILFIHDLPLALADSRNIWFTKRSCYARQDFWHRWVKEMQNRREFWGCWWVLGVLHSTMEHYLTLFRVFRGWSGCKRKTSLFLVWYRCWCYQWHLVYGCFYLLDPKFVPGCLISRNCESRPPNPCPHKQ